MQVVRWQGGEQPAESELSDRLAADGLSASGWGNGPGQRYDWHSHEYNKILYCVHGSIVFHTDHGDVELGPGDRLELAAGTAHAALVGPAGVRCIEAAG